MTTSGIGVALPACGTPSPATPHYVQVVADDYVPVPFLPRPPPVEVVPPKPATTLTGLVWADGGWEWSGERFRWDPGSWVAPPEGAKRARWVVVRRAVDGQLFFAPSTWRSASGQKIEPPAPLARAVQAGAGGGPEPTRPNGRGAPAAGEGAPRPASSRPEVDEPRPD